MSKVISQKSGGFKYIKGVFQYSGGVAALPGCEIERVRFKNPLVLKDGFAAIKAHLKSIDRPLNAFCACELRSPDAFTEEGFENFNNEYVGTLEKWGILHEGNNPVARSNVCPESNKPEEPGIYAFCYTVPTAHQNKSCMISGSAEMPEGKNNYRDHVVCYGDQSPDALREKGRWVLGEMERRLSALGFSWADVTATHLYTVYDIHHFLNDELVMRGAMPGGLTWHFARPPIDFADYEMDVRSIWSERVLAVG
jgi:hypothetical protein